MIWGIFALKGGKILSANAVWVKKDEQDELRQPTDIPKLDFFAAPRSTVNLKRAGW